MGLLYSRRLADGALGNLPARDLKSAFDLVGPFGHTHVGPLLADLGYFLTLLVFRAAWFHTPLEREREWLGAEALLF
ncbi:MAG: hypothetical protein JWM43_547 [Acidobacteriaceae bacterium]|nr:hypothetical protein [Acidobacteriaceae bacterium]